MAELSKAISKIKTDEITLRVRRLVAEARLSPTQMRALKRVDLQSFLTKQSVELIRAVLDLACLEEPIQEIPADWWQHFKLRWFPKWLKRRFPVKMEWIAAIHKFPELDVPPLGREYLHLRVVDSDKLIRKLEEDEPKE